MTEVRRYAAAIVMPPEVAGALAAIQEKHGLPPWEPRIPLHITLASPFTTHAAAEDLVARLQHAAVRLPFDINLDGFGRFDNDKSIFYCRVTPSAELSTLADDVLASLSDFRLRRKHPFYPHIALAAPAPRQVIDDYLSRCAADAPRFSFACDRFSLFLLDEEARIWHVITEFPFVK